MLAMILNFKRLNITTQFIHIGFLHISINSNYRFCIFSKIEETRNRRNLPCHTFPVGVIISFGHCHHPSNMICRFPTLFSSVIKIVIFKYETNFNFKLIQL